MEIKLPKSISKKLISNYFSTLARKANAKTIPGSPEAKARTEKAREVLRVKREARKAAEAAGKAERSRTVTGNEQRLG